MKTLYLFLLCWAIINPLIAQEEKIEKMQAELSDLYTKCSSCLKGEMVAAERANKLKYYEALQSELEAFTSTHAALLEILQGNDYNEVGNHLSAYQKLKQCAENCRSEGAQAVYDRLLKGRIITGHYEILPIMESELIAGGAHNGSYFLVNFKNALIVKKFLFETGKYTLGQLDVNVGESINKFVNDIIKPLADTPNYKIGLYCKGSADMTGNLTFIGEWDNDPRYHFQEIITLKSNGAQYLYNPVKVQLPNPFKNKDLPNYRAAFMQAQMKSKLAGRKLASRVELFILEGEVASFVGSDYRNVSIFLFVAEQ